MKTIYRITIKNWDLHNKKATSRMPYILLSKRFFDDAKIQTLSAGGKLLYLGLLLRRGDVDKTFIEASHEVLVRLAGGSGQVVSRLMRQLESLQLLSYEKIEPLINRIEDNIIEENRKEEKKSIINNTLSPVVVKPLPGRKTFPINSYFEFSTILSDQVKRNLVELYPDNEYLKREFIKMHSWLLANPKKNLKSEKGWTQFVNGWMDRGWAKHQQSIPSNVSSKATMAQSELRDRITRLFESEELSES